MFATQINLIPKTKHTHLVNKTIKIPFTQLQTFYNNLIQQPIRPNVTDFFIFNHKVDIQEKFHKYQDLQQVKQIKVRFNNDQDIFVDNFQEQNDKQLISKNLKNKNIVFNLQHLDQKYNQAKYRNQQQQQQQQTSRISYFHITQNLKNTLTKKNSNKSTNNHDTNKRNHNEVQQLRKFLFEKQCIFFLVKGAAELHKKVEDDKGYEKIQKIKKLSKFQNYETGSINSNSQKIHSSIQQNWLKSPTTSPIFYSSSLQSFPSSTIDQNNYIQLKNNFKKHSQVKQNTFFTLFSYKNSNYRVQTQQQFLKIVPRSESIIAKITINSQYGLCYLQKQYKKLQVLSNIFLAGNKNQARKSTIFKDIFYSFKEQIYRRDSKISIEGQQNEFVYILANQGQVQLTKSVYFKQNANVQGTITLRICNIKGMSIFNGQKYLSESKNIRNILKSHSFYKENQQYQQGGFTQLIKNSNEQYRNQSQYQSYNNNADQKYNNYEQQLIHLKQPQKTHKKKQSHTKASSIIQPRQQLYLGKNQTSYLKLFTPQSNINNFNIRVQSTFITVYKISLIQFQHLITQRMKSRFIKYYQQLYTTYLRRSIQKLIHFTQVDQKKQLQKNIELEFYEALDQTNKLFNQQLQQNYIIIPRTKLQFHNKLVYKGLKRKDLAFKDGEILEKRVSMLKSNEVQSQKNKNMSTIYKSKIEGLIFQNLKDINSVNQEEKSMKQNALKVSALNKYYTENLAEILMQEGGANRSEDIQRHKNLLSKKLAMVSKEGNSSPAVTKLSQSHYQTTRNQIFFDKDSFDPTKNKYFKINLLKKGHPSVIQTKNYLKGINITEYTGTIKNNFSTKINQTNKIKQQFMKIESKCDKCKCYDDLDMYKNLSGFDYATNAGRPSTNNQQHRQHRNSSHDVKYHTMKIGVNWKTKSVNTQKNNNKNQHAKSDGRYTPHQAKKITQPVVDDEPFQKVYNRIRVLKQKSLEKFNFTQHLIKKGQHMRTLRQRKKSAPLLLL